MSDAGMGSEATKGTDNTEQSRWKKCVHELRKGKKSIETDRMTSL
jgi:hypothetical protein